MSLARLSMTGALLGVTLGSCAEVVPPPQAAPVPPKATVIRDVSPPKRLHFALEGALTQGGLVIGSAPSDTVQLTLDSASVEMAADGRFVIGFGRDRSASATLIATLEDGRTVTETLPIARRDWILENLTSLPKTRLPSAEFRRLREPELVAMGATRALRPVSEGWRQRFAWPATGRVSGWFGSQRIYRGEPGNFHNGVDVAVPTGTPLLAPADGVVMLATDHPFTTEGNMIMIGHGMGLVSTFLHLSRIDVRTGDTVRRGQMLGATGATGRATGPHMHWGMRWKDERIDPQLLAGPMPTP